MLRAKGCTSDLCNSFPLPNELLSQFPNYKLRRDRYNQASASVRAASANAEKARADADAAQKAADTALSSATDPDVSPAVAALIQVKLIHSFGCFVFFGRERMRFREKSTACVKCFGNGLTIFGTPFWNELGPFPGRVVWRVWLFFGTKPTINEQTNQRTCLHVSPRTRACFFPFSLTKFSQLARCLVNFSSSVLQFIRGLSWAACFFLLTTLNGFFSLSLRCRLAAVATLSGSNNS